MKAAFSSPANEALFGLGQHQDGVTAVPDQVVNHSATQVVVSAK